MAVSLDLSSDIEVHFSFWKFLSSNLVYTLCLLSYSDTHMYNITLPYNFLIARDYNMLWSKVAGHFGGSRKFHTMLYTTTRKNICKDLNVFSKNLETIIALSVYPDKSPHNLETIIALFVYPDDPLVEVPGVLRTHVHEVLHHVLGALGLSGS